MKKAITFLILLLFFASCYKDSGEIAPSNSLGPVYPEIQLEPEWVANLEEDEFHYPQFMLETSNLLIYHLNRSLFAIDVDNGESVWVFDPAQFAYPGGNLSFSKHLFEYEGFLYFFAASASEVLKIDINNGSLVEVIPLPTRGPDKTTHLESFFYNGKLILHRLFYDFDNHHSALKLYEFDLNTREEQIVGEVASVLVVFSGSGRPPFTDFDNNITYYKSVIRHDTTTHMSVLFKFDLTSKSYEIVWSNPVMLDPTNEEIFISHGNIYIPNYNLNSRFLVLDQNDFTIKWETKSMYSHYFKEDNVFLYDPGGVVNIYNIHGQLLSNINNGGYINGHGIHQNGKFVFLTMIRLKTGNISDDAGSFTSIYDAIGGQELIRIAHPDNDLSGPRNYYLSDIYVTKDGKRLVMQDKANIYSYPWPEIL